MIRSPVFRAVVALAIVATAVTVWLLIRSDSMVAKALEVGSLIERLRALGPWGPVAVIATMSVAILISPLPSAPIALAAGAAFGHTWGTLYVLAGSELGALIAFALSRYLGHDFVHRHFGARLSSGLVGSQNALMATVFASRLLPFVSFDLISYASGLTVITFGRFAVATLAGILPASFLLARFGSELSDGDTLEVAFALVFLGALGLAPLIVHAITRRRGRS